MAYEDYCAACTYMGESADYNGKYYCSQKGECRYACDSKCYNFCEAYSRSNYSRSNMLDNSKNHMNSGCYLTTIMCKLLGYPDNNYYLNTLREFRKNIMQKDPNYFSLLLTYDVVGPVISKKIETDPNNKIMAITLFNNYIEKAVRAIEEGKNETAINIYKAMTTSLADRYKIMIPLIEVDSNINPQELGHGYTRGRTYKEEKRSI